MTTGNFFDQFDGQGNPSVRPIGPRNSRLPAQIRGDVLGNAQTQANTGRTVVQTRGDQIDNDTKRAIQADVIRKARADAQAAQNAANGITPELLAQRQQQRKNMAPLLGIINDLEGQYNRNFRGNGGTSGRGRITEYMPDKLFGRTVNPENDLFNSTAMRAGPFIKGMLFPGGKDTDAAAEYQQKIMPFLPSAGDADSTIESKIKQLRSLYNAAMGVKTSTPKAQAVIDFEHWGR